MDAEIEDYTTPLVQAAVRRVAGKWRRFLAPDELRSIGWLWVYDHPGAIRKHQGDGERGERRLTTLIARAMDAAGRAEKAMAEGYSTDDEAFYNVGTIELVLPAVWDPQYRPWRDEDAAGRRKPADGSTGMGWETMVADVSAAVAGLTVEQRNLLRLRYAQGTPTAVLAAVHEVSLSTVHNYLRTALRALLEALGGVDPRCRPGCECHEHKRVESTAASLARLEHAYDPS